MPVFKLADIDPKEDRTWDLELQFQKILKSLGDSKYNYKDSTVTRTLIPVNTDSPMDLGVRYYHKNYIEYLTQCWSLHYGIVVDPNHVWYTLLCEMALKVKADPETYRPIFTDSPDKKDIIVPYDGGGFTISLDLLMGELQREVPTDTNAFFPEFSTNSRRSRMAKYAAFADMASPYYNYWMLACAFRGIDVRGSLDDWKLMSSKWQHLSTIFTPLAPWFARVQKILDNCVENYNNPEWWKTIYTNERCGSGGEVFVSGWFSELFFEKCSSPKPDNFSPCVSIVDYTRINLHDVDNVMRFTMKHGLLFSREQDGFLVPDFGHFLFNVSDEPQVFTPEMKTYEKNYGHYTSRNTDWVARLEPENMVNSPKMFDAAREIVKKVRGDAPGKLGPYQQTAQ